MLSNAQVANFAITLLDYMPDRHHHFFFNKLWNTGARFGEGFTLMHNSVVIKGPHPFVRILS